MANKQDLPFRTYDTPVYIRVRAREKTMIMHALDITGLSLSKWARRLMLLEAKKMLQEAGMHDKIIKAPKKKK